MPLLVGTSGWQYKDWARIFYPAGHTRLLSYYADRFQTVEVNATFYRLPEKPVFEKWKAETPADFKFAVKASRFLTHMKKLKDPKEPIDRLLERTAGLGHKLEAILVQLPAVFSRNDERLEEALAAFPERLRIAVEFRHESWFVPEVRQILERREAALCLADRDARLITPVWRTAPWAYLRMHHGQGRPLPCYDTSTLLDRARLLVDTWDPTADLFVYFNNDTGGCAIRDAVAFAEQADKVGLQASRALV